MTKEFSTQILTIEQIAYWWLPEQLKGKFSESKVKAQLPALQRGFVWKSAQVELLWDSILKGFPIGSLLLSEYDTKTEPKTMKGHGAEEVKKGSNPTHFILDGQQRTTTIALGFNDIWSNDIEDVKDALWVDLKACEKGSRQFLFRMVTKSHPWGYRKVDPKKAISSASARKAMTIFEVLHDVDKLKPHECNLQITFPWDATAPVPLAFLILAIQESKNESGKHNFKDISEKLLDKLKDIKLYSYVANNVDEEIKKRQEVLQEIIRDENNPDFKRLVESLSNALDNVEVPAPVMKNITSHNDSYIEKSDVTNPLFTLFQRINNAGTNLSNEEINYSQLKSVWPDAASVIEEQILKKCNIAKPARLVTVLTRLYLMVKKGEKFRGEQSIKEFSVFLENHEKGFKDFCQEEGLKIVSYTWSFLTVGDDALPKVLAAGIAQKSSDLMLLIMFWVKSSTRYDRATCRNRTLGFFSAIVWFSSNTKEIGNCAKHLANGLQKKIMNDENNIAEFFNYESFNSLFIGQNSLLIPLPKPDDIREALHSLIIADKVQDKIWSQYWWEQIKAPDKTVTKLFNISESEGNGDVLQKSWEQFFKKIYQDRRFLLYAQRSLITTHFDWFDPILPDQTQDRNRPWDYDHILPYNWTQHDSGRNKDGVPRLVKAWVHANGNFRAWPYELNRSKGDGFIFENEVPAYDLSAADVYDVSFVRNKDDWKFAKDLKGDEFIKDKKGKKQKEFITVSINRTVDIYNEWYETLQVKDLMEEKCTCVTP